MAKANIVKKLSMRHLVGNVKSYIPTKEVEEQRNGKTVVKDVPAIGETAWLASVVGIARGTKTGQSTYGEWTALTGDFVATAMVGEKKGQRFRTGQLFLPDVVLNMITAAIDGKSGVEFAFNIGITAADTEGERPSATGYEYTADFLTEPAENDPLAGLVAALPAPEATDAEKPADAPHDPETGEIPAAGKKEKA